ncbi:MAG: DUF882 domain-containing protein [Alphaproteobacteria bacterium]|nr:DUF882 domain-containing protein [Alphaproteobacteria bacterium]
MTGRNRGLSRRQALRSVAGAAAALVVSTSVAPLWARGATRGLAFEHLHTGENLTEIYWRDGTYDEAALARVDVILRDWRTDAVARMDRSLLDRLWALHQKLGSEAPYQIISGYRSPRTNAVLAAKSTGVAKKSLHMQGRAIDVALSDRSVEAIGRAAEAMRFGGVGYYPKSGFVHLDTGRVRRWRG